MKKHVWSWKSPGILSQKVCGNPGHLPPSLTTLVTLTGIVCVCNALLNLVQDDNDDDCLDNYNAPKELHAQNARGAG